MHSLSPRSRRASRRCLSGIFALVLRSDSLSRTHFLILACCPLGCLAFSLARVRALSLSPSFCMRARARFFPFSLPLCLALVSFLSLSHKHTHTHILDLSQTSFLSLACALSFAPLPFLSHTRSLVFPSSDEWSFNLPPFTPLRSVSLCLLLLHAHVFYLLTRLTPLCTLCWPPYSKGLRSVSCDTRGCVVDFEICCTFGAVSLILIFPVRSRPYFTYARCMLPTDVQAGRARNLPMAPAALENLLELRPNMMKFLCYQRLKPFHENCCHNVCKKNSLHFNFESWVARECQIHAIIGSLNFWVFCIYAPEWKDAETLAGPFGAFALCLGVQMNASCSNRK